MYERGIAHPISLSYDWKDRKQRDCYLRVCYSSLSKALYFFLSVLRCVLPRKKDLITNSSNRNNYIIQFLPHRFSFCWLESPEYSFLVTLMGDSFEALWVDTDQANVPGRVRFSSWTRGGLRMLYVRVLASSHYPYPRAYPLSLFITTVGLICFLQWSRLEKTLYVCLKTFVGSKRSVNKIVIAAAIMKAAILSSDIFKSNFTTERNEKNYNRAISIQRALIAQAAHSWGMCQICTHPLLSSS